MRRLTIVALLAGLLVAPTALAAQNPQAKTPPAEELSKSANPEAHEGGEKPGEEEEIGPPPPMNVADFKRYGLEKCIEGSKDPVKDCGVTEEELEKLRGHAPTIPYVYIAFNALLLYLMYYYLGRKPISEGLKARRDAVAKELDEAAKIKAEAQDKLDEYSERLDKLDQELDRLRAELTLAGEKDRDRLVKEAEERAERMRKDAQFLLDQESKQLRIDLQKYAVEAAMRAAEQAIKTKLSAQDFDRVAEEYVANIGKLSPPGVRGAIKGGAS